MLRHGEPWLVEIVAGVIDEGEAPEQSARREIEEEVGYRVRELRPLGELYNSPGGLSEKITLFYAEVSEGDRTGDGGGVDDGEDIEEIRVSEAEAYAMLDRGELRDAKTQVALLRYRSGRAP
jgi:ADP-ribose pyrophosphatase